jgi:protein phosphatase
VTAAFPRAVRVESRRGEQPGRRSFLGVVEGGGDVVIVEDARQAETLAGFPTPWDLLPDRRLVRPVATLHGSAAETIRVYPAPPGVTARAWLQDPGHPPLATEVLAWAAGLCEIIESIHGSGHCLLALDLGTVWRTRGGDAALTGVDRLYVPGQLPDPATVSALPLAAPEVAHRLAALSGPVSDVYSVAALVHALLARRDPPPPARGSSNVVTHRFSPRCFRPEVPLGIWPRLAPALHPDPLLRTPHAAALRACLLRAAEAAERRSAGSPGRLRLEAAGDLHLGVGKERRGGSQQDRVHVSVERAAGRALCAVADGITHSRVGDGGAAAEITIQAVAAFQETLQHAPPPGGTDPADAEARAAAARVVVGDATARICAAARDLNPPRYVESSMVMASTLVMAWVSSGRCTVLNVGDSRAYLYDGAGCEPVTVDHDRQTEAIRDGLDPAVAVRLGDGGSLLRAVGRVGHAPDGTLVPAPSVADVLEFNLLPGDWILLCSDGLPDYAVAPRDNTLSPLAVEERLAAVLKGAREPWSVAHDLIGLANRNGGGDNIAVVALHVREGR